MSDIGPPSIGILEQTGQAPLVNLAIGKAALQSSTDIYSAKPDPAEDARGAVSGTTGGVYGFHTSHEDEPWWQVDLGAPSVIREIVVFNRGDQAVLLERAIPLEIALSDDGRTFRPVHRQEEVFEGRDGAPLRWSATGTVTARFVRLTARKVTCLHLDEVEVYGAPVQASGVDPANGGGMGQASALGTTSGALNVLSGHQDVAKADLLPSLPVAPAALDEVGAPAATADQGLELLGNDPPRELGEADEAPRTEFWQDAVTSRPIDPAPAPVPREDGLLAKLRRALFGG